MRIPVTGRDLIRSPKSGSDWTANELLAYNIKVSPQSPDSFYGQPLPTLSGESGLEPHFLSGTLSTQGLSDSTHRLLSCLDLASKGKSESAVDDFGKDILHLLKYDAERDLLLRSRHRIPLLISGDPNRSAQTDVCLIQGSSTVLLVAQEDKSALSTCDPEPQVIAQAIAAFQYNNRTRNEFGKPELTYMTIPCITMVGTRPIFYLVPVTSLKDSVKLLLWRNIRHIRRL
ncbi:hypothetical protein JOM56_002534 [Amanita muscaria]